MNQIFSSQKVFSNINGEKQYSEETYNSINNKGIVHNNAVLRQSVKVKGEFYIITLNIKDKKITLLVVDKNNNKIEKDMDSKELLHFFRNIKKTLPELIEELESNISIESKTRSSSLKPSRSSSQLSSSKSSSQLSSSISSKSSKKKSKTSKLKKKKSHSSKKKSSQMSLFRDPENFPWY